MNKKRVLLSSLVLLSVLVVAFSVYAIVPSGYVVKADVEVDSILLKLSVKQGDFVEKSFTISSERGGEFNVEVLNLEGVDISEHDFSLQKGESRKINAEFNSSSLSAGVYAGSIKITSENEISYLPVIFEVESEDIFFDVNLDIPPQYNEIAPGGKLLAQVKIFDLTGNGGLGPSTVNLDYNVYRTDGSVLSSESESVVVASQLQISKTVSFPENAKEGDYVFAVVAKYKSSVGTSTRLFRIAQEKTNGNKSLGLSSDFDWKFFSILAVILIFFLGIIVVFIYLIKDRDKLVLELYKHNDSEMKRQRELLLAQEKFIRKKGLAKPAVIKREIKKKIKHLKARHKKRVKEFRKLRKKGDIKEMKRRLDEWKKRGYNTLALEYKLNALGSKDMKKLMNEWKKEYKT